MLNRFLSPSFLKLYWPIEKFTFATHRSCFGVGVGFSVANRWAEILLEMDMNINSVSYLVCLDCPCTAFPGEQDVILIKNGMPWG